MIVRILQRERKMSGMIGKAALLGAILVAAPAAAQQHGQAAASDHAAHAPAEHALHSALAASTRTPANVARDRHRHPAETLTFFGVKPGDTVVELWPGGGWYTEILAPYLASGGGTLYAVAPERSLGGVKKLVAANPAVYGGVKTAAFSAAPPTKAVPDGTADVVLTFRNVHNWMMGDAPFADEAFRQAYAMLKPGGVLGVVDHRLPDGADSARERTSGYVKVSTVKQLAQAAGFQFAGASEVNANPKDTADWKDGVWTLPPSLALKDQGRAKYEAIGESDRMTLKFVKPM
jgi:predicted methyltransferase